MKITYIVCGVALLLAAILSSGGSSLAVELGFTMQEIRDPQMNNAVAARVAVPQGWVLKEQRVPWNMGTYAAPAHVFYTLRGPADEVEFSALSRLSFAFNYGWPALHDFYQNMYSRMSAEQCAQSRRFSPDFAHLMCDQMNASIQPQLQKIQQGKEALLAGNAVEDGMVARQPMWAADVVQRLASENRKITDVRITKVERPADLAALLQKAVHEEDAQVRQMAAQLSLAITFKGLTYDVARVFLTYAKGGKRYESVVLAVTRYCTFTSNQRLTDGIPGAGPDPLYGKDYVFWTCHLNSADALAGRLQAHEAALTAIAANSEVDPLWQAAVDNFAAEVSRKTAEAKQKNITAMWQAEMKHQQKMQQMRMDTFNYVNKTRKEVFARRSESLSRVNAGWTDAITSRQVWQDGGGEKVVIPDKYDYAWKGSDGKIIGSNDSNFDPNISSNHSGNWERMQKSTR